MTDQSTRMRDERDGAWEARKSKLGWKKGYTFGDQGMFDAGFNAGWLARGKQGGSLVLWEERQKAYSKVLDMLRDMKGKNTAQAITELVELANTDPIVPAAPTETAK